MTRELAWTGTAGELLFCMYDYEQPLVLSGLLSADVGFVDFDNPRQFGRIVTASLAQPLKHEPCGLLRDADLRMKLDAANAFAGRDEQIHRVEPFVQRHLGPLEDGSGSDGEIEQAGVAAVEAALAGADAHRLAARRAGGPVRPAPRLEIDAGALLIGEHLKQFKSADGGFTHRASNPLPHPLHQQRRHRGHCSARKSLHTSPAQAEGRAGEASLRHGSAGIQYQRSCVISRMIAFAAREFVKRKPVVGMAFWSHPFVQMVRYPFEADGNRHVSRFKRRLHITALWLVFSFQRVWMLVHSSRSYQANVKSRSRNWWPNQRGAGLLPVRSANSAYSALPFASKRKQRSDGLRSSVPLSSMNTPLARVENLTSIAASYRIGRNCPLHEKITTIARFGSQVYNSLLKDL